MQRRIIRLIPGMLLTFFSYLAFSQNPGYNFDQYDIHYYDFDLEVTNMYPQLSGKAGLGIEIVQTDTDSLILELADQADIDSIHLNEVLVEYNHQDNLIVIELTESYQAGSHLTLEIFYHIDEGDFHANRGIVTDTEVYGNSITWTLSEPFYSKNWFPCKQDLTDKIDSARLSFTCPDSCMVGSNGILSQVTDLGNGKTKFVWETRYPMAYYLISYAVADYMDYSFYASVGENDSTLVQNFIYNDSSYLSLFKEDIDATADLIRLFSELYSTYPFKEEKYGHCLAPIGGGMEHQTMTTLSDFRFGLVAHELGHQWFGDYTTCSDWQNIWINEGFASYTEVLALEFLGTEEDYEAWLYNALIFITSEPGGSVYVPETELNDDRRIFDHRLSYKKGAYLIHMIRHEIGDDELFFHIIHEFLQKHANATASAEDFKTLLEENTQRDFTAFFDQWYYGEGYPILDIHWRQEGDSLIIKVDQESSLDNRVSAFELLLDLEISFLGGDTLMQIRTSRSGEEQIIRLNEKVYKLSPDPDKWLVTVIRSVNREESPADFGIFPNPAHDQVFIENYNPGLPFTAKLYSASGIFLNELAETGPFASFSVNSLSTGIYRIVVTRGNKKETFQFAKI